MIISSRYLEIYYLKLSLPTLMGLIPQGQGSDILIDGDVPPIDPTSGEYFRRPMSRATNN